MADERSRIRRRREQLEAMLASGQARVERARSRSMVVDTMVGVVQRERPVAVGILAASLAFRLFALMIPLAYVAVAGLGFAADASPEEARPRATRLADLVLASVADATRTSGRGRWVALILGGVATLVAAHGVLEVLRWVHLLAWRMAPSRARVNPGLVLGLITGLAVVSFVSTLAEQARADAKGLASELTVILVTAGAQVVVLAVLWLAVSLAMPRQPTAPWTSLVPGACLFAAGFQGFGIAVSLYFAPRAARASTLYGSLGVALVLLVSLFLFARLAVAAAELNAALWERRRTAGR
ncbi:MAG TPA: YhjD/YihY/BrkB family envelope integrity protein [Actinomycetota bacterium]|nr:YhjD/YihY/BrkB family envelope integrity protein [Actinomycetota bacterium]